MKTFTVKAEGKLSEFLFEEYKSTLSYSQLMKLFRKKDIKINGKRIQQDCKIFTDDEVTVYFDGKEPEIPLIYKCDDLIAVYKRAGITSEDFYSEVKSVYNTASFVHRLDRNTSGLMIFGLNDNAENELLQGFKKRTFQKFYKAEVYGFMPKDEEILTAYLVKDEKAAQVRIYDEKVKGALIIKTAYKVLEKREKTSLLSVELLTGRTHQIRAHLSHTGHFIIGDGKYGNQEINRLMKAKYQRLSAYRFIFHFEKDSKLSYLDGKEIICEKDIF